MANFKKNEEGVSAVIGVILMVAITVILAAVIAAFVFQLGNQMPSTGHQVGVQVYRVSADTIAVKVLSGDTALLRTATDLASASFTATAGGVDAVQYKADKSAAGTADWDAHTVGDIAYFPAVANADVTIIAHYTDGSQSSAFSGKIA